MTENFPFASEILEGILQNSQEGIVLLKAIRDQQNAIVDFEYVIANGRAQKIIGKPQEELLGNTLLHVFPTNKTTGMFYTYVSVVDTGKRYEEERFINLEGVEKPISIHVSKMLDGILINFNDISDLKKMVVESSRNQHLYKSLVKCLPGVEMALIDRNYKISIMEGNPFRAIISSTTLELGEDLHDKLNEKEAKELFPLLKHSFKGNSQRKEMDVEEELYRMSFVPIREDEGKISHVLMISEDITIFRFSQNELRNKIYALESANESLEQFAYVASHDLQEPLRKIRAFGDRLSTKYSEQLEGSGKDYIERMQNAAARMQTLIGDLLKFSRVGRFREPFQPIAIAELIREISNDMETTVSDTEASIIIKELPVIHAEPLQMRQLFQNLVSNGIKFHKENVQPEIVVSSAPAEEADLEELAAVDGTVTYHKISVTDNGIGFDEKYLDRIFNIFQRLHGRSEYKGTGIGLAICRKIAENHGGAISATSQPGEGSSFYVILPEKQITEL